MGGHADPFARAPEGAADAAFGGLPAVVPQDPTEQAGLVDDLLAQLSLDERIGLMSGDGALVRGTLDMSKRYNGEPIVAGAVPRLGVPGIRFTDGPRGIVMYRSTAFPSSMARAATFDPTLEERVGDAIGVEARAQGANLFAGVCINLLRHPAWGRAQETYGEDPHLLGEMGAALVRGIQRHVMACAKHYAANSMENSRFWVDVQFDERDLRDLYLPHFRRVVDEGVAAIMTAYNRVDGVACGHHHHLVTEILKEEWGFDGFVMSDFTYGVHGARAAVLGGLDLEMPFEGFFKRLRGLVRRGRVPVQRIDDAARRLLSTQVRFATRGEPERYRPEVVASAEHRGLAREAATRSMVLLRNEPVGAPAGAPMLPLDASGLRSLAVIGALAVEDNLGDLGSSQVHPPEVVTVLEGLEEAGDQLGLDVRYDDGRDAAQAAAVAAACDAVVVLAGSSWRDEGEWIIRAGGDRRSLRLADADERLIRAVAAANPSTAVVLVGGSAFVTDPWAREVAALVMAWYPGMEGGRALADVLFGVAPFEGRLPCTWPRSATRLPPFRRFALRARYGPLHGYRMMEAERQEPDHWFGHGLTTTTFRWSAPELRDVVVHADGSRTASIEVEVVNVGRRLGTEVVQAYVPEVLGSYREPLHTLRGSAVLRGIEPGASALARLQVHVPAGVEQVRVAPSAGPVGAHVIHVEG